MCKDLRDFLPYTYLEVRDSVEKLSKPFCTKYPANNYTLQNSNCNKAEVCYKVINDV